MKSLCSRARYATSSSSGSEEWSNAWFNCVWSWGNIKHSGPAVFRKLIGDTFKSARLRMVKTFVWLSSSHRWFFSVMISDTRFASVSTSSGRSANLASSSPDRAGPDAFSIWLLSATHHSDLCFPELHQGSYNRVISWAPCIIIIWSWLVLKYQADVRGRWTWTLDHNL